MEGCLKDSSRLTAILAQLDNFLEGNYGARLAAPTSGDAIDHIITRLNRLGASLKERMVQDDTTEGLNANGQQRMVIGAEQPHTGEASYRHLFANNPMPLWVIDTSTLRFLDVNDSAVQHYGYSREEFLSMTSLELRPEEDRSRYLALNRTSRGTENMGIWQHVRKDGSIILCEVIAHEMLFEGKAARLILANDITEKIKAEQEILELNRTLELRIDERTQALQEANKELESFTYSVSHDLRAPLRAIHGYSQMLLEDYDTKLDAEGIRLLNAVQFNAKRMGQLVDDLLAFSRMAKRALVETETDLTQVVLDVLEELSAHENEAVDISVLPLGMARADEMLMRQAFHNLISNAVKYSSRKEDARIEIGRIETAGVPTYYVKDNGAGFDMTYYKKLFGVFQRLHTQEEFEGTGVGLAIVHRIIQRHGGKIWAEGRVGEGATFFFTLG